MNCDNDSYQVNITRQGTRKPSENKQINKSNSDSFFLPLFLAIVVGIWASPDLIDIRDYIPSVEENIPKNTKEFPYQIDIKKNESTDNL